jgi:putative sterol carrier protein
VVANTTAETLMADGDYKLTACRKMVRAFRMETRRKQSLYAQLPSAVGQVDGAEELLADFELSLAPSQLRALAEVLTGAGYHRSSSRRNADEAIIVWNNDEVEKVSYRLAALDMANLPVTRKGALPRFGVFAVGDEVLSLAIGNEPSEGQTTASGWFDNLPGRFRPQALGDAGAVVQFDIAGAGGRTAYLQIQEGRAVLVDGVHAQPSTTIAAEVPNWLALINGQQSPVELFLEGKIVVSGDLEMVLHFAESLGSASTGTFQAGTWKLEVSYGDALTVHLGTE